MGTALFLNQGLPLTLDAGETPGAEEPELDILTWWSGKYKGGGLWW